MPAGQPSAPAQGLGFGTPPRSQRRAGRRSKRRQAVQQRLRCATCRARRLLAAPAATLGSWNQPASADADARPPFLVVQARFCAALALAHAVKLQPQALSGATPGIISPTLVSPAGTDEPGAEA